MTKMNEMKMVTIIMAVSLAMLLACGSAFGGSASITVPVTAEIVGDCTVSTGSLNFDYVSGMGEVALTTTLNVNCTNTLSYNIEMDGGLYSDGSSRRMADTADPAGGDRLSYDLYHDDCTSPWYTNEQGQAGTGNGQDQTYTVCGKIFGGQDVSRGTYQDTVIVHVMIQ